MQQIFNFDAGHAAKEAGIERVSNNTPDDYKERFKMAVLSQPFGRLFTSDDILETVGLPPNHVNGVGAMMSGLAKQGLVKPVSYTTSKRESRHAAIIRTWQRI